MSHRRIDALRCSCSKITSCEILSLQEKNITATSPPFPTVPLRVCSIVIETGRVKSPLVFLRIEIFGKSTRRFPFVGHHDFFRRVLEIYGTSGIFVPTCPLQKAPAPNVPMVHKRRGEPQLKLASKISQAPWSQHMLLTTVPQPEIQLVLFTNLAIE